MLDNTFSLLSVLFPDRFGGLFFVSTETSSSRITDLNSSMTIREFSLSSTILHLDYPKEHRKGYHTTLLMEGTLNQRLCEIDNEAKTMVENIISRLVDEKWRFIKTRNKSKACNREAVTGFLL